ncbi:MAG: hypothetical protein WBE56_13760 [Terracidiphilus sp.]
MNPLKLGEFQRVPKKPSAQIAVNNKSNKIPLPKFSVSKRNGETSMQWSGEVSGEYKSVAFALSADVTLSQEKTIHSSPRTKLTFQDDQSGWVWED